MHAPAIAALRLRHHPVIRPSSVSHASVVLPLNRPSPQSQLPEPHSPARRGSSSYDHVISQPSAGHQSVPLPTWPSEKRQPSAIKRSVSRSSVSHEAYLAQLEEVAVARGQVISHQPVRQPFRRLSRSFCPQSSIIRQSYEAYLAQQKEVAVARRHVISHQPVRQPLSPLFGLTSSAISRVIIQSRDLPGPAKRGGGRPRPRHHSVGSRSSVILQSPSSPGPAKRGGGRPRPRHHSVGSRPSVICQSPSPPGPAKRGSGRPRPRRPRGRPTGRRFGPGARAARGRRPWGERGGKRGR